MLFRLSAQLMRLLLLVLLVVMSGRVSIAQPVPIDFLPPLCGSNVKMYGHLVRSIQYVSIQLCQFVSQSESTGTMDCYANGTFTPPATQQLDPSVSFYSTEVWRSNPSDLLSGWLTAGYTVTDNPNLFMSYKQLDPDNNPVPWENLIMVDGVASQMDWEFDQGKPWDVDSTGERKPLYQILYLLLAPPNSTSNPPQPQLNESCVIMFGSTSNCCLDKQPPLLVLQPYWVLLLSTIAYFVVGYAYVYLMITLERFACWRRCTKKLKEYMDFSPIPSGRTRMQITTGPGSIPSSDSSSVAPIVVRDGASSSDGVDRISPKSRSKDQELSNVDAQLRKSFRQDYLTPLMDSSSSEAFSDSVSPSSVAVAPYDTSHDQEEKHASTVSNSDEASSASANEREHPSDEAEIDTTALTISERVTRANAGYLIFQLIVILCNLFYLIFRFTFLDHSPTDAAQSNWYRYQQVYMFWTNSSMVTLLASALASHLLMKYQYYKTLQLHRPIAEVTEEQSNVESETCRKCYTCGCCCMCCRSRWVKVKLFYRVELPKEKLICRHIACAVLVVFSPAIITHVIPMWFLYFPILLLVLALLFLGSAIVYVVFHLTEKSADTAYDNIKEMYVNRKKRLMQQVVTSDEIIDQSRRHSADSNKDEACGINDDPNQSIDTGAGSTSLSKQQEVTQGAPRVTFPWYSILLLRILSTITIVVLFQTTYNYAQLEYTNIIPYLNEIQWNGEAAVSMYILPIALEYGLRHTDYWYNGMQQSMHQFLMQLSLFF